MVGLKFQQGQTIKMNNPKSRKYWPKIMVVAILCISIGILYHSKIDDTHHPLQQNSVQLRFVDETGALPSRYVFKMNNLLQYSFHEIGADIRFLVVASLHGQTLEEYAVNQARTRGVGSTTDEHGILVVYVASRKVMRIEVGPKLEGVLTDAFVGYLERENTRAYANVHELGLGLKITWELIVWRLRNAELGMNYDPRTAKLILDKHLLAEGAGATADLGADSSGEGVLNRLAPPQILDKYVPQPTVQKAWEEYESWEMEPYVYTNVTLFTKETRRFLKTHPMSRAFNNSIILQEYNQHYHEIRSGNLAMLVFDHSPFISPYYFRLTHDGWVMDIVAAIRNSQEIVGNHFTWKWRNSGDEYSRAFLRYVITIDGVKRIAGGDNRPLPIHGYQNIPVINQNN